LSVEEAALGIIRIANSNMLNALKLISIRKGHNPGDFSLVAFGGGGSMHAPALAKELGVKKVIVPVASSVFSAWGMLMTDLRHDYIQTYIRRVSQLNPDEINNEWSSIERGAFEQFKEEGISEEKVLFTRFADIRYLGQEHTVKVPVPAGEWNENTLSEVEQRFGDLHEKNYTFKLEGTPTEIVNLHVTAFGKVVKPQLKKLDKIASDAGVAFKETRPVYFEDKGWIDTNVYHRQLLGKNVSVSGPAIVEEPSASTVIYPGQSLLVDEYGNLIIDTGVE
jgi:N-methylhydantoinase A